ncbi:MAG TPA: hypothetical protein VGL56_11065 [Fimbriimonadaceae bacterium]|jgi:hypothetical protein
MLKTLSILALVAIGVTCAFATDTISGSMGWVSGTATATINPSATAQTIVLKVGTVNKTYPGVLVIGSATSTGPISSGDAVELMVAGSQPFAATYSAGGTISAFTAYSGDDATARRAVPISTTGVTQDAIAFANTGQPTLEMLTPNCNIAGTYLFYGGVDLSIAVPVAKYSVSLPAPSVASGVSTVAFPTGSLPMNTFDFLAEGESTMEVGGRSSTTNVYCSGQFSGSVATFTSSVLSINNDYEG